MNEMKRVLKEVVLIAGVGVVLGFGANAVNRRGLNLGHNYFPKTHSAASQPASRPTSVPERVVVTPASHAAAESDGQLNASIQAVRDAGLRVIMYDEVVEVFRDPAHVAGDYIFVDARNDEWYAGGHIPGAYQLDHYYAERYMDAVLPACQTAQKVVVYCEGGDCEDSRFAALDLLDRGIDPSGVFVYVGGIKEWKKHKLELEIGGRLSGRITTEYGYNHE